MLSAGTVRVDTNVAARVMMSLLNFMALILPKIGGGVVGQRPDFLGGSEILLIESASALRSISFQDTTSINP